MLAGIARLIRTFGFGLFSVGLHLTVVVLCILFAAPTHHLMAADKDWIDVEMQPALGLPHGKDDGKKLGSHVPKPKAPAPKEAEPEPFSAPLPPPDPEAIPTTSAPLPEAGPPPEADAGDAGPPSEAGVRAEEGEYDPTTPVGSENVAPAFGSENGVEGGQGTAKRGISPQYKAILAGWARARFPALGVRPEGPRYCASVRIQLSGQQVSGTSMSSSGNDAWDTHVRASLGKFQGATVPADPDGGPAPPSIGLNVCWD